jgi:hypothetical protein
MEHGILFKAEMVKAYLAGNKTKTRRTRGLDKINDHPADWVFESVMMVAFVFKINSILNIIFQLDSLMVELAICCGCARPGVSSAGTRAAIG